jgi:hypothetical protein
LPPLCTPFAASMGFCHDGSAEQLVRRALQGLGANVAIRERPDAEICRTGQAASLGGKE